LGSAPSILNQRGHRDIRANASKRHCPGQWSSSRVRCHADCVPPTQYNHRGA
jgi:hypothetical protein